jgi:hypothetical protein
MNGIIWFFDLYSQYRDQDSIAHKADGETVGGFTQLCVYFGCLAGILAGPYALDAAKGKYPSILELFGGWSHLLWSVLFGFVLTAALFKLWLTPKTPLVSQIGIAIAVGIGSGKLIPLALQTLVKGLQ